MFRDARSIEEGSLIERDLCVIGAGAVGIALALELADSPYSVGVLESGGIQADEAGLDLALRRWILSSGGELAESEGMTEAALGVDTKNPNGALRLYEGMGFRAVKRHTTCRKPLD